MIAYRAIEHAFTVDSTDPDIARFLADLLGPLSSELEPVSAYSIEPLGPRARLSVDGAPFEDVDSAAEAVDALLSHVNLAAVGANPSHLLLHAGGLSGGADAVVLPAASGSGKTSLTLALVEAGLDYLSDETVAVAVADLTVTPYPKPFTVKASGQALFPHLRPPPGSLAERYTSGYAWHVDARRVRPGCIATEVARPSLIVAPRYESGAATKVERLTRGAAMAVLGANTSALRALGPHVLDVLDRVTQRAPAYRLTFSDLGEARDAVLGLLGSTT